MNKKRRKLTSPIRTILSKLSKTNNHRYTDEAKYTMAALFKAGYSASEMAKHVSLSRDDIYALSKTYFPKKINCELSKDTIKKYSRFRNGNIVVLDARSVGVLCRMMDESKHAVDDIASHFGIPSYTARNYFKTHKDNYNFMLNIPHGYRIEKLMKKKGEKNG